MEVNISLIKIYSAIDYVPVASTVTNLYNLFQKATASEAQLESKSHYYTHLGSKSAFRCIVLLLPVFGNVAVVIYDAFTSRVNSTHEFKIQNYNREFAFEAMKKNAFMIEKISPSLKSDLDFAITAIGLNPDTFNYFPTTIQNKEETILAYLESSHLTEDHLKYFAIQRNLFSFFQNKKVMVTCVQNFIYHIKDQQLLKERIGGLLLDIERTSPDIDHSLLVDDEFMRFIEGVETILTPDEPHLIITLQPQERKISVIKKFLNRFRKKSPKVKD